MIQNIYAKYIPRNPFKVHVVIFSVTYLLLKSDFLKKKGGGEIINIVIQSHNFGKQFCTKLKIHNQNGSKKVNRHKISHTL